MKADERKQLERNELAARLIRIWQGMTSNSTAVTIVWGVILLGLVGLIGYRYYSRSNAETRSEVWANLDRASDVEELEKIIRENKNSDVVRIAKFHLSRFQLQDALNRLAGPSAAERLAAADTLEKARDRYAELAKANTGEPLLTQEALMGVAKAEEVLSSVPTANDPNRMRGDLDKALEAYDALAKKYPKSFMGEKATKRAIDIRDHHAQIEAFYIALSKVQGTPVPFPAPPPLPTPPAPNIPGTDLPKALDAPKATDSPKSSDAPKAADAPKPDAPKGGGAPNADSAKPPETPKSGEAPPKN